ncbi:MAG: dodecin domain-containing protein [Gammaproteobacteria bacterium]
MLKVVEILAQSEKSWEDAAQLAVQEAAKTVATSNRSISRRWRRRSRTDHLLPGQSRFPSR